MAVVEAFLVVERYALCCTGFVQQTCWGVMYKDIMAGIFEERGVQGARASLRHSVSERIVTRHCFSARSWPDFRRSSPPGHNAETRSALRETMERVEKNLV